MFQDDVITVVPVNNYVMNFTMACMSVTVGKDIYFGKMDIVVTVSKGFKCIKLLMKNDFLIINTETQEYNCEKECQLNNDALQQRIFLRSQYSPE